MVLLAVDTNYSRCVITGVLIKFTCINENKSLDGCIIMLYIPYIRVPRRVKLVYLISLFSVYESMGDTSRINATTVMLVVLLFGCFLASAQCMHCIFLYIFLCFPLQDSKGTISITIFRLATKGCLWHSYYFNVLFY